MKSFDDFWNSFTDADLSKMVADASASIPDARLKIVDGNVDVTPVITLSTLLTRQILQSYHDWLSEQL